MASPPTRLLILTTTLPARPGDGTPEFVLALGRALAPDLEVIILAPRVRGAPRTEVVQGVTVSRFAYWPRRWEGVADGAILPNLRSQPWRLLEVPFLVGGFLVRALLVARREHPAVLNAHWILPAGAVAAAIRRLLGIPYVLTVHGADVHALNAPPLRWLKRKVVAGAHTVTPVSREIGKLLHLSDDELGRLVVPMGVDADEIRRQVGVRSPERGRFLFVGRLAEKKGVDVLLAALARVPAARLVILGGGPEETRLRALAAGLEVGDRVEWLGQQPSARVMREMRVAHALVIPSKVARDGDKEGTPLVMGEAMAASVPIVASHIGGLSEHIRSGDNGLLVRPGSEASLGDALAQLMRADYDPTPLADTARRDLEGTLDLRSTTARYLEFIRAAASRGAAIE